MAVYLFRAVVACYMCGVTGGQAGASGWIINMAMALDGAVLDDRVGSHFARWLPWQVGLTLSHRPPASTMRRSSQFQELRKYQPGQDDRRILKWATLTQRNRSGAQAVWD